MVETVETDTRALNVLLNSLGTESFTADVSINGEFEGNHNGRIDLHESYSAGKLEIISMDSNEFHTSFDVKFQDFSFSPEENRMSIKGTGIKPPRMIGSYEVVLKNIQSLHD